AAAATVLAMVAADTWRRRAGPSDLPGEAEPEDENPEPEAGHGEVVIVPRTHDAWIAFWDLEGLGGPRAIILGESWGFVA
ncbi:MAG: hypothetical protein N3A38_08030, partial [Planctomycetota bacterium]|nr:hypothetical protein [Planctomycetota bacterium]